MAKKSSGSKGKKSASEENNREQDNSELEQKPVEKIKVNRSRRRLYETPEEGRKSSIKKKVSKKTTSKSKNSKKNSTSGVKKDPPKKVPVVSKKDTLVKQTNSEKQSTNDHLRESNRIVEKYSAFASGSVLLPVPGIDIVYITGIQLKMLSELSKVYDLKFKRDRGKAIVTSLISGIFTNKFMFSAAPFMVRYIPIVGFLLAPLSIVLFSSALTYSVGKVFIQHFEAGGTFLNFNPEEVRAHFREEFARKYQVMKDDS